MQKSDMWIVIAFLTMFAALMLLPVAGYHHSVKAKPAPVTARGR